MMPNFSDLFSESCRQGNLEFVKSTDEWLLTDLEQQGRAWALNLQEKHGSAPNFDLLKSHPDHRVLATLAYQGSDLKLLHGITTEYLVKRKIDGEISALNERSELEGAYPVDDLGELAKKAKSVSVLDRTSLLGNDIAATFDLSTMVNGVTFGFEGLDSAISFLLPGEMMVLAARLGVGKSVLVCYEATRWAQFGKKVLVVSCEMLPSQLMHRIYGLLGGFNPKFFRMPQMANNLTALMPKVMSELASIKTVGGDIVFPRDRSLSIRALETAILEEQPDIVIVDGIYLLSSDGPSKAKWEQTMSASNGLKQLAMEYELPMFCTTQFKRSEKQTGFDPQDIAYSDAIGQDADIVVSLMQDEEHTLAHRLIAEVIKNRSGEQHGKSQIDVDWGAMTVTDVPFTRTTIQLGTA